MILDVLFLLGVLAAFYSGYKQGVISSVLNFIGIFLGVIIALNFSTFVGVWLVKNFNLPELIIPALSFVVVILVVVAAVKTVAFLAQKILQMVSLNFVNKLAGGLLFGVLASFLFSVLFTMVNNYGFFTEDLKNQSQVYPYVAKIGPEVFKTASNLIPIFKDIYEETNTIFKQAAENI